MSKGENIPFSNLWSDEDQIPTTKISVLYKRQMVYHHDQYWLESITPEAIDSVYNCECRSEDIWIDSYPRSGSLWMNIIVGCVLYKGNIDMYKQEVKVKMSLLSAPLEIMLPTVRPHILNSPSPRILNTHLPYHLFPHEAFQKNSKIIIIIRNPKDVAVSYYYIHKIIKKLGNFTGSWHDFYKFFKDGDVSYGSWFDHVLGWWAHQAEHKNLLFISFEELKKDLPSGIRKVAEFLQQEVDNDGIEAIAEFCSFKNLQSNPNNTGDCSLKAGTMSMDKAPFLKEGEVGDWKYHFSKEENKSFDAVFEQKLKDSGLQITFLN